MGDTMGQPQSLRVLIAIESLDAGSGRHTVDLALGLSQRGHQVTFVYAPHRANNRFIEELREGEHITLHTFRMKRAVSLNDFGAIKDLDAIATQHGPFDILHGQSSKGGLGVRMMKRDGAKKVYTAHAFRTLDPNVKGLPRAIYATGEKVLAGITDAIICGSTVEYEHALSLGLPKHKLHRIVNGMWPMTNQASRASLHVEAGLPTNAVCVGFIGRMAAQKNPLLFVRAFADAAKAAPDLPLHAIMLGTGTLQGDVDALIADLQMQDRIHMMGSAPGAHWLPAFDMLAMSSDYEAMPYVYVEALFSGTPIITTQVGGAVEAVDPGVNGVIVPVGDQSGLTASMLDLATDWEKRDQFAQASRQRADAFHMDVMVEANLAVYHQLLDKTQ